MRVMFYFERERENECTEKKICLYNQRYSINLRNKNRQAQIEQDRLEEKKQH